jgi:hypothetical protein
LCGTGATQAGGTSKEAHASQQKPKQPHQQGQERHGTPTRRLSGRTLQKSLVACLLGFRAPGVEQHYKIWVAEKYSRVVYIHSLMFVLWIAACFIRDVREGLPLAELAAELPMCLLSVLPYVGSMLVEQYRAYR